MTFRTMKHLPISEKYTEWCDSAAISVAAFGYTLYLFAES